MIGHTSHDTLSVRYEKCSSARLIFFSRAAESLLLQDSRVLPIVLHTEYLKQQVRKKDDPYDEEMTNFEKDGA